jgi:O-antigen/teichoic acid export membrane protein
VIRILALVSMIGLFGEVTGPIFNGLGQPYKVTIIEVVQSVMIIALVWLLTSRYGLMGAALAWVPTAVVSQIVSAILLRRLLPQPLAHLGPPLLLITAVAATGVAIALRIANAVPGLAGLVLANLLAVMAMGLLLWLGDRRFALGLRQGLGQIFPQVATLVGSSPVKS